MKRFVGLLEEVYGKAAYKASKQPNWVTIAKRPTFIDVPKQKSNDCGFFVVKFCSTYHGDELVDDFGDVMVCFVLVLVSSSFHFSCVFLLRRSCCGFSYRLLNHHFISGLQAATDDWKAEFMHTLIFSEKNEIVRTELPTEIRSLGP